MLGFITPIKTKTTVNFEMFSHKDQMAQVAVVEGVASVRIWINGQLLFKPAAAFNFLTATADPILCILVFKDSRTSLERKTIRY